MNLGWLEDHINLISLIAAIVILALTAVVVGNLIRKMKNAKPSGNLTDHSWDGISEFVNNVPIGWAISFILLILWGFWYVIFGYPLNSYSQIGEYNHELAMHNAKFEEKWANLSHQDKIRMGQGIFLVKCSQCHGVNAEGINGRAANLTHWSKVEGIMDTIKHGSVGLNYLAGEMPPIEMSEEDARLIAEYILSELSIEPIKFPSLNAENIKKAKELFDTHTCSSCHGEDGKGMDGFAADLTKYGSKQFLKEVLEKGKKGHIGRMPSFDYANFNDTQIEALSTFINSLQPLDE